MYTTAVLFIEWKDIVWKCALNHILTVCAHIVLPSLSVLCGGQAEGGVDDSGAEFASTTKA